MAFPIMPGAPMFMMPNAQPPVKDTTQQEKDKIEQKTHELILMTSGKGPRRWRQRKTEYLKKLEEDNGQLKSLIVEIQQQISALKAQNDILKDQLQYFQGCLSQAAPMVYQQTNPSTKD